MKNSFLAQFKVLLLCLIFSSASVFAETPEEKGLRIAIEADNKDKGFGDVTADMEMVLKNRNGQTSERLISSKTLESKKGGDKSISLFNAPADVKGTAMLTFSHGLKPDDQWLYLPALKRVKRINSRSKSGPFMGSEFAFEDLGSQEVEKYTYKYLREEKCGDGQLCHVIERIPAYKDSGYTRIVSWIDAKELFLRKAAYYDRKNVLLKTLVSSGYKQYLDKYWRPAMMKMDNHQTGKSTALSWNNYKFKTGLSNRDFNKNALKR